MNSRVSGQCFQAVAITNQFQTVVVYTCIDNFINS